MPTNTDILTSAREFNTIENCGINPQRAHEIIDELLSLVDSQVAEDKYVCEVCGQSDEHTLECPTPSWCPGCGSRKIGHQWNTCHDAAILMRSACIGKVRYLRDEWQRKHGRLNTEADLIEKLSLEGDVRVADQVINALESVTIQEQKS